MISNTFGERTGHDANPLYGIQLTVSSEGTRLRRIGASPVGASWNQQQSSANGGFQMDEAKLLERLKRFRQKLERGDVLEITQVKRVETADGPMHIREKTLVEPNEDGKYEME